MSEKNINLPKSSNSRMCSETAQKYAYSEINLASTEDVNCARKKSRKLKRFEARNFIYFKFDSEKSFFEDKFSLKTQKAFAAWQSFYAIVLPLSINGVTALKSSGNGVTGFNYQLIKSLGT